MVYVQEMKDRGLLLTTPTELDAIRNEVVSTAPTTSYYRPQDLIQQMVDLATKLDMLLTLLPSRGLICSYSPNRVEYRQIITVTLSMGLYVDVVLHPFSIYAGSVPVNSIKELVLYLDELEAHMRREQLIRIAATKQCLLCHYSDSMGRYCGKGLLSTLRGVPQERVIGCSGYKERSL
jgi:hypothetical protein